MTTLYKPVLIESAAQAEALPVGTVAMTDDIYQVSRKIEDDGAWQRTDLIRDLSWDEDMIGWTALVPIEAEEQFGARDPRWGTVWASTYPRADRYEAEGEIQRSSQYGDPSHLVHRLVTPWEEGAEVCHFSEGAHPRNPYRASEG